MTSRRGFTLVELMVALVLLLLVGAVIYQLLVNNQRVSRAQTQHVSLQDNVRAGALIVANELREVGYDEVPVAAVPLYVGAPIPGYDLVAIGVDSVRYKAMRGFGFLCSISGTADEIVVWNASFEGLRQPAATDSVTFYVEGDNDTSSDDAWVHGKITAIANKNCPDGKAGTALKLAYPLWVNTAGVAAWTTKGAPVRVFEVMVLRHYDDGAGRYWLGIRSISAGGNIEPVVGPLVGVNGNVRGLSFRYYDLNENETALIPQVRSVRVELQGITGMKVQSTGMNAASTDSLKVTTQVALRNAPRP